MRTSIKMIYWIPRILCILAIAFISLFAADAFTPELPLFQQILGLFMHLIPSFILASLLIIAWKRELLGGIIFALIGIVASPFIYLLNHNRNHFTITQSLFVVLMITFPFILVGVLFVIGHFLKKK